MPLTALIGLINTISTIGLALFVFSKNPLVKTNQAYLFFGLSVGLYSMGYFLWGMSKTTSDALFAFKVLTTGIIFINSGFLEFSFYLLGLRQKNKMILLSIHLLNVLFAAAVWSELLFSSVGRKNIWGYWPYPSLLFYAYFSFWIFQMWYGLSAVRKGFLHAPSRQAVQLRYVFYSTLIGYIGGGSNWLPWFGINFPPYLNALVSVYVGILAYAIVRHRLMDIEVIIKKTLVFAGIFTMFMAIVGAVTAISQSAIGQHFKMGMMANSLMSVLVAVLLYDPVRRLLVNLTDRYLFQRKEDIRDILNKLTQQVITILDLREVGSTVLNTLKESMRLESGAVLIKNETNGHYEILGAFNLSPSQIYYSEDCVFMKYFSTPDHIANIEDPAIKKTLPNVVAQGLESLNAVIAVPLFIHRKMIGLLTMGKKKSDQEFSREEITYLPTVAGQVSIALSNARLLEALVHERSEKIKAQNEAKMVGYGKTIAHEIKNALAGLYGPAQFMTMYAPEDLTKIFTKHLKDNDPIVTGKKFLDFLSKMKNYGQMIYGKADEIRIIARTAEGTLSSDEELLDDVSIKVVWDSAKSEAKAVDCRLVSYLPDRFIAYGNVVLLQRVLVNLINNAAEAMNERRQPEKEISLRCEYGKISDQDAACFELSDNGPGMSDEIQSKIFNQGFSTKPKPKSTDIEASGHGHGLFICKEIIEKIYNGKMWVESKIGQGTTFKFWIPCRREVNDLSQQDAQK